MSTPVWPVALPLPQLAGYAVDAQQSFQRSQFEQGPGRYRALGTAVPNNINAGWRMTLEQREVFRQFYRDDLKNGALWFEVRLDIGDGLNTYLVHFYNEENPYQLKPLSKFLWELTATLEVRSA